MKKITTQGFGEEIHDLLRRRKVGGGEETGTEFVTNNVVVDLNMFGALMETRIVSNVESRLIVTIEGHGSFV